MRKNFIAVIVFAVVVVFFTSAFAADFIFVRKTDNQVTETKNSFSLYIGSLEIKAKKSEKAGIVDVNEDGSVTIFIKGFGEQQGCWDYLMVPKETFLTIQSFLDWSLVPVDSDSAWCTKAREKTKTKSI